MCRSVWKVPFSRVNTENLQEKITTISNQNSLKQNKTLKKGGTVSTKQQVKEKQIHVWSRGSMILPHHIGQEYSIYTGKSFVVLKVIEKMVGHKFGEFSSTRKKAHHKVGIKK